MAWQTVSRKGGGKGRNQGMENRLLQSITAVQKSISQLAQSLQTQPPLSLRRKGQGKGRNPKGHGKGNPTSPGERKTPNLKPFSERATPTTEEFKCPNCPACNWTTRSVCRSRGHKPARGTPRNPPPLSEEPQRGERNTGWGWIVFLCRFFWGLFCCCGKRRTGQAADPKEEKDTQHKKAESLEESLATLAPTRAAPSVSQRPQKLKHDWTQQLPR